MSSIKETPIGVTLGWNMKPTLMFADRTILFGGADKLLYPEYYINGDWPCNPETGEKMPIV